MKASDLGEFGLIARLTEALASRAAGRAAGDVASRLAVGIGDDAAVWRSNGGAVIATTDTLVAGVHFLPERTPRRDLGWKALAVNVSDVAAMGGAPDFALVTLALPEETPVSQIDELYEGLSEAAEAYGVVIAGGDVVRSPTEMVSVALTGRAEVDAGGDPLVMRRDAAREGDLLAVTGCLGGAGGGLRALRAEPEDEALREAAADSKAVRALIERHLRPQARAQAGRAALSAGIRCAIDVSDGLLQDLGHLCRASGLGAIIQRDKLPIDPALAQLYEAEDALRYALAGGEDYELLLAGSRESIDEAARQSDVPLTVIGEMVADPERRARLLDASGREIALPAAGWDHLRPSGREHG